MNDLIRELTDEEKLVAEYIRQNPGLTIEDICNDFGGYDDEARRAMIASACGFLVANHLVNQNPVAGALYPLG